MEGVALRRLAIRRGYICPSCIARQHAAQPTSRRKFHTSPLRRQGLLEKLEERGLVNQIAGNRDTLSSLLANKRLSIYAGVDPTAPSLHLGHLLPLMVLFWLHSHGHNVISLVGGATSRVGDPAGRLTSRQAVDAKEQRKNFRKMWNQTERLWERAEEYGKRHGYGVDNHRGERHLLDNASWLDRLNVLDFLRVLGNGMRVGTMLGRDTVRNKLENGDGMSFSEFTYPLLQGWDWWHMYKTYGTQVQVGGSDQYGNIIAGMDAVRSIAQNHGEEQTVLDGADGVEGKATKKEVMGLTVPLLTTASGEKFGKSAGNAVWLDLKMTTGFDLYGFLLKTADADVERYLKLFTFVPLPTISETMVAHNLDPGQRKAQHLLAGEILELVHGPEEAAKTKKKHQAMRKPTLEDLKPRTRGRPAKDVKDDEMEEDDQVATAMLTDELPTKESPVGSEEGNDPVEDEPGLAEQHIILAESRVLSLPLPTVLHNAGLASSKSEASRMISGGGVYVARKAEAEGNGGGWESQQLEFVALRALEQGTKVEDLLIDRKLVLRLGKWKVRVVEVLDEGVFGWGVLKV